MLILPEPFFSFNSKLVRLKVANSLTLIKAGRQFQFQTGAIKRLTLTTLILRRAKTFQFQTGAIKSCKNFQNRPHDLFGFNSKLVRLKVAPARLSAFSKFRFNSKLVRLKGARGGEGAGAASGFQFQTGAIKRNSAMRWRARSWGVSIPNWCD